MTSQYNDRCTTYMNVIITFGGAGGNDYVAAPESAAIGAGAVVREQTGATTKNGPSHC